MIEIARYTPEQRDRWDSFVRESKNATFLHYRGYMDYHSHRFKDFSLMASKDGRLLALLPANIVGTTLFSHQGLTYGGWLMPRRHLQPCDMIEIWRETVDFLRSVKVKHIVYKAVPYIYHTSPADEDIYALNIVGAGIESMQLSSVIDVENALTFDQNTRRNIRQSRENGVAVRESDDMSAYWNILTTLLRDKYGSAPVHSLGEMMLLKSRFPENIRLVAAYRGGEMLGGMLLFISGNVVRTQYICSTEHGRAIGALPAVMEHVISNMQGYRYIDLGTSAGPDYGLNNGLVRQKYGFGARGVAFVTYKLDIME